MADAAAMSPFHFQRLFRATTGMTPHAYVMARRMERARRMLNGSKAKVAYLAGRVRFLGPCALSTRVSAAIQRRAAKLRRFLGGSLPQIDVLSAPAPRVRTRLQVPLKARFLSVFPACHVVERAGKVKRPHVRFHAEDLLA